MLAMRQTRAGFDVWSEGSAGGPPLCVLASADAHYCVGRAVQVMGWGQQGVEPVAVDEHFRMSVEALPAALRRATERGRNVLGVVATAGSSASGAVDPLVAIADFCESHDLWLHVDGAHGASAAFSETHRPLLQGIERADSVVWDGHKLLALPGLATAVVYRDGARSYAPFRQQASYLFGDGEEPERWYDYGLRNMECTKRMISVKVYLTLAALGTALLDRYVSGRFELARRFAAAVADASDFVLACEPECNIVCFRYAPKGEPLDDDAQDRIRVALMKRGDFLITRSRLAGRTWMRCTIMSPHTRDEHLADLLDAIRGLDATAA
jgi:L-2,4-diaminobutyrate decarboxylase